MDKKLINFPISKFFAWIRLAISRGLAGLPTLESYTEMLLANEMKIFGYSSQV